MKKIEFVPDEKVARFFKLLKLRVWLAKKLDNIEGVEDGATR